MKTEIEFLIEIKKELGCVCFLSSIKKCKIYKTQAKINTRLNELEDEEVRKNDGWTGASDKIPEGFVYKNKSKK